jgi:hypothetical protein
MMKMTSLITIGCLAATLNTARSAEQDGWVNLSNGKDLAGWEQHGGKAKYRVESGEIVGTAVPNTGNSFLCTQRPYTNFILELEFKVDPSLNSGVQIRSEVFPQATSAVIDGKTYKFPADRVHGYQVEIDPGKRAWTGGIYDEGRRAWLKNLEKNDNARAAFKQKEWNKFRIECVGDSIKTWLNGAIAAELKDSVTPAGIIALQVHGVGKREDALEVRWRNLRIKELP